MVAGPGFRPCDSMPPARHDIDALYRAHGGLVRARIRRFFPEAEADDVLQEVFVRVIEKIESFRGESSTSTWLYQLTTRHCLNRLRDRSRRHALWTESGEMWSAPVTPPSQEARTLLGEIWRDLDEEMALIAIYYHLDQLTRDDVATLVGLSSRTVGYRLEALRKLAEARGQA